MGGGGRVFCVGNLTNRWWWFKAVVCVRDRRRRGRNRPRKREVEEWKEQEESGVVRRRKMTEGEREQWEKGIGKGGRRVCERG